MAIKFAINVPNFGEYADPRTMTELARSAEVTGWDGFFVWDHINAAFGERSPMADPWVLLAAISMATERIRIGTMVTPLARRRPWKVARETVTLDHLSGGRLILGVGLGHPADLEFAAFGEESDDRHRAQRLDEGLEVLTGLWRGEPFSFAGEHYDVANVQFLPTPVQRPRIPIWVAQTYPHRRPLVRAARWDGLVPMHPTEMFPTPAQVDEMVGITRSLGAVDAPLDVNVSIVLSADRSASSRLVREFADAGATWLQVGAWSIDELRAQIAAGPPG